MLVLTRKLGESITIGDHIKVTVISVRGNQVKLGIDAPAEVPVHRAEIAARIIAENRKAATSKHIDRAALHALWQDGVETGRT